MGIIIEKKAYAKINLALDITGTYEDGFHEIDTLMQAVSLCDTLTFEEADELTLDVGDAKLSSGEDNLILRAARALAGATGHACTARIRLDKRIPVGAGLAGGSSDAAATLLGLNELWGTGLDIDRLRELGASLGSDIPYCLLAIHGAETGSSTTVRAWGKGDELEVQRSFPSTYVVLAKPPVSIDTGWAYGAYDMARDTIPEYEFDHESDVDELCDYINGVTPYDDNFEEFQREEMEMDEPLTRQEWWGFLADVCDNVFTQLIIWKYNIVLELINKLSQPKLNALMCNMSGSGPTVFAIYETKKEAERARDVIARGFRDMLDSGGFLTVCRTL